MQAPVCRQRLAYPGTHDNNTLAGWFAGGDKTDPPAGAQLRLIPCSTAAQRSLLPGFAVRNIGLITKTGVLQLGRTAIAFAPESFGDPQYEALYGSDFL